MLLQLEGRVRLVLPASLVVSVGEQLQVGAGRCRLRFRLRLGVKDPIHDAQYAVKVQPDEHEERPQGEEAPTQIYGEEKDDVPNQQHPEGVARAEADDRGLPEVGEGATEQEAQGGEEDDLVHERENIEQDVLRPKERSDPRSEATS